MGKQHRVPNRQNRQRTSGRSITLLFCRFGTVRLDDTYEIARHCPSLSVCLSNFILFDASANPAVANRHQGSPPRRPYSFDSNWEAEEGSLTRKLQPDSPEGLSEGNQLRSSSRRVAPQLLDHLAVALQLLQGAVDLLQPLETNIDEEDVLPRFTGHRSRLDFGQVHLSPR